MGAHLADAYCLHGIENYPAKKTLVFLRLSRSATGQPITTYSSHLTTCAGQELHIVIVDNGRSRQLGREDFATLKCIRCAV
jgi:L-lactate dehydrogenase complex protein LldF